MTTESVTDIMHGFYCGDAAATYAKLEALAQDGMPTIRIISDFDLTLTRSRRHGRSVSSWDIMDSVMPPEGVARHRDIYARVRPLETKGELTNAVAEQLWGGNS